MRKGITLFILLAILSVEASAGVFDLGWKYGEMAFEKCKPRETKKMKGMCAKLQEIIEDAFDDQGMQLQNAFENQLSKAITIASKPPFSTMGLQKIDQIINWMFQQECTDYEKLKGEYIQLFFKWFGEVLREVDRPGTGYMNMDMNFDEL